MFPRQCIALGGLKTGERHGNYHQPYLRRSWRQRRWRSFEKRQPWHDRQFNRRDLLSFYFVVSEMR